MAVRVGASPIARRGESVRGTGGGGAATTGRACRVGVADGRFAAELAARAARGEAAGQPGSRGHPGAQVWPGSLGQRVTIVLPGESATFLARYPVSVLDDPVLADLLPRLGLHTLGDFAALPPADAASRFGPRGALAH